MKKFLLLASCIILLLISCQKDPVTELDENQKKNNTIESKELISSKVKEYILSLGFSESEIVENEGSYIVNGDIEFPKTEEYMYENSLKQARVADLISNRFYLSIFLDEGDFNSSLRSKLSTALNNTITAYNNANSGLMFRRTTNSAGANLVINEAWLGTDICGMGTWPTSGGQIGNLVRISQSVLLNYSITSVSELTFLLAHEIGHNIGLRHTNWQASGESTAIQITGTPTTDSQSVMNSGTCGYSWNNFSSYDIVAINAVCPRQINWTSFGIVGVGWNFTHYFAADWSGDGAADLMVRNSNGELRYYEWHPSSRSWTTHGVVGVGWNFTHYFAADWSGDGEADLMVRNSSGQLVYYEWHPSSRSWTNHGVVGVGWNFTHYFALDWSGDGAADLMVRNSNAELRYYEWHPSSRSWTTYGVVGTGWNFQDYLVEDFNGDGKADIIGRQSDGRLLFYSWTGSSFDSRGQVGHGFTNFRNYLVNDFTGNNKADIMAVDDSFNLLFYRNN